MSSLAQLTALITNLTNRFNWLEANAKKVEELPVQTILNPNSKIPVSNDGNSEHITIQQILSSVNNSSYNQLLFIGEIDVNQNTLTIPAGAQWQINGLQYTTTEETVLQINYCDQDYNRIDILVGTNLGTIIAIAGEESQNISVAPPLSNDSVFITQLIVTDNSINSQAPVIGTSFVKKTFASYFNSNISGENAIIELDPNGFSEIRLTNSNLTSLAGFNLDLITGIINTEIPYTGKPYVLRNLTGNDIILRHLFPNVLGFELSKNADINFPNNQSIYLHYTSHKMIEIFKSWNTESYRYVQNTSSNEWVITHNLGKYPSVNAFDIDDNYVHGNIVYNSLNQLKISFTESIKGQALIN